MNEPLFSQDDVRDAHFAKSILGLAKTERDTPEGIIRSNLDGWNSYNKAWYAEELQMFARGKAILDAGYRVIYSDSHVQLLDFHAAQLEQRGAVTELVRMESDYIGTTQRYCYAALVRR